MGYVVYLGWGGGFTCHPKLSLSFCTTDSAVRLKDLFCLHLLWGPPPAVLRANSRLSALKSLPGGGRVRKTDKDRNRAGLVLRVGLFPIQQLHFKPYSQLVFFNPLKAQFYARIGHSRQWSQGCHTSHHPVNLSGSLLTQLPGNQFRSTESNMIS